MQRVRFGFVVCAALTMLVGTSVDVEAQNITLGAKAGVNFANVADVDDIEVTSESDFVGGAYLRVGGERWLLQPELLFSKRSVGLSGSGETGALQQDFLEIPVLIGIRLGTGTIEPTLYAGASASFESNCSLSIDGFEGECGPDEVNDLETNSTLWAGIAGLSLDLDVGPVILGLDGRYNYGLTDIDAEGGDGSGKWRYFSLLVQAGFALGR
jgi:hypothetical protein